MSPGLPLLARADDDKPYTIAAVVGAWGGLLLGERLSRAIFENATRDKEASATGFPRGISMPALMQAPLLAVSFFEATGRKEPEREYRLDLLEVRF